MLAALNRLSVERLVKFVEKRIIKKQIASAPFRDDTLEGVRMNRITKDGQSNPRGKTVRVDKGPGGLPILRISNEHAESSIFTYGAHVASFKPKRADEMLFISPYSKFEEGQPIRGGIPICFPWFGKHETREDLQLHGLVRTKIWDVVGTATEADGSTTVVLSTHDDEYSRSIWPHRFSIQLTVFIAKELTMILEVKNIDDKPFTFGEAFHTYFSVGDLEQCNIIGLDGLQAIDRMKSDTVYVQSGDVKVSGAFTRVYRDAGKHVTLADPVASRSIRMEQDRLRHVVVWNPGEHAAMNNAEILEAYKDFLCVEHANFLDAAIDLNPGETHRCKLVLSVLSD